MEPRSIERGERINHVGTGEDTLYASMEPRSIERGETGSGTLTLSLASASMEPRSIERGEAYDRCKDDQA